MGEEEVTPTEETGGSDDPGTGEAETAVATEPTADASSAASEPGEEGAAGDGGEAEQLGDEPTTSAEPEPDPEAEE